MQSTTPSPAPAPSVTVTATATVTASPNPQGWLQRNGDSLSVTLIGVVTTALLALFVRHLLHRGDRRGQVPHADGLDRLLTDARSLFAGKRLDRPDYFREWYTKGMQQLEPIHAKGIPDARLRELVGDLLNVSRSLYPDVTPGSVHLASREEQAAYRDGYERCENLAKRALERLAELRAT